MPWKNSLEELEGFKHVRNGLNLFYPKNHLFSLMSRDGSERAGEKQGDQERNHELDSSRRNFLKLVGVGAGAAITGGFLADIAGKRMQNFGENKVEDPESNRLTGMASQRQTTVDINDGDDIAPILEDIGDGDTVVLPQGTYELRGNVSVDADNWKFDGNGSIVKTFEKYEHALQLDGSNYEFSHVGFKPQNKDDDNVWLTLYPYGADWHVHHLAWLSEKRVNNDVSGPGSTIRPGVTDDAVKGELTDIWLGAGVGDMAGNSHLHCFGSVDGPVWVRRCYFYQGGTYAANSSKDKVRNEGTTHFESCYFENCYNTCARTGGHYQDTYIRDCVMNLTDLDDVPSKPAYDGNSYFRGVWAWHGPVILENVHISADKDRALAVEDRQIVQESYIEYKSGAYTGRVQHPDKVNIDSSVGSDPKTTPPENCVTSAEEAYSGTRSGSDDWGENSGSSGEKSSDSGSQASNMDLGEHVIEIIGTDTDHKNYIIEIDGEVLQNNGDTVLKNKLAGVIQEGTHEYTINGVVTDFKAEKGLKVKLDGNELSKAEIMNLFNCNL